MNRLREIDFLRGIAIILVLFRHHTFFKPLYNAGWIGVDLFFVLSGYLVSKLLFQEYITHGKINPIKFLIRRGFKIYPLFYVLVLLTIGMELFFWDDPKLGIFSINRALAEILFLQNYFQGMWNHTWSLAVEEHFYVGLTAFVLFITKLKNHWKLVLSFCLFIFTCCLGLRIYNHVTYGYTFHSHLFPTHLRIDSLLFGVLLSYLHCFKLERFERFFNKYRLVLSIVLMVLISSAFLLRVESFLMSTFGLTSLYLGFGLLLSLMITSKKVNQNLDRFLSKWLTNMIASIGVYSYGIYLFHLFIERYLIRKLVFSFNLNANLSFLIYLVLCIVLGIMMSRIIEQPFLRLRERFVPRTAP